MRRAVLLGSLAAALACSAWKLAGCASCGGAGWPALAGTLGYAGLLALAATRGPGPALLGGLSAALGVHAVLVATMISRGPACVACVGAAGAASLAWIAAAGAEPSRWSLLPSLAPWSAALVLALPGPVPESPGSTGLHVVAYTNPGCPYCDELRDRVWPEASRGIPATLAWRPAESATFVTRTPTLVLSRGSRVKVLEGLPPAAALRAELLAMEGGTR